MSQLRPINTSWCLEKICESNFQKLLRLIPNLQTLGASAIGQHKEQPSLHLSILERNRYTLTVELGHHFGQSFRPAVTIRVYLDAKLAEVISDHDRPAVTAVFQNPGRTLEIQEYKWQLNYFLQKWLDHCLTTDYHFSNLNNDYAA